MLLYILICVALTLAGITGLQFTYMFYLERIDAERRKRVVELERQCRQLTHRLAEAEQQISEQKRMMEAGFPELDDEEVWADVIDER
jgi:16S rRNA C1402 (ribose-2'-O) methylase RsmI